MLERMLKTFGSIFEALCVHDLRLYAEADGGKIFHYHDSNDNEIDAIVETHVGSWGAFEIKIGAKDIEPASKNPNRVCNLMVKNGAEPPKVKCVICGMTDYAYRREDGTFVTPIIMLGPRHRDAVRGSRLRTLY